MLTSACCSGHNPLSCIVPDYVLEQMADHGDPKIRESVNHTLTMSRAIRADREVLSRAAQMGDPAGQASRGKQRFVYTADNTDSLRRRLVRSEGAGPNTDVSVNEVYDGFGNTYDFLKNAFGRDSVDGSGMSLIGTVHLGVQYNNAFWTGREMGFVDGDGVLFRSFTKSLDVIGHELGHGVVTFNGNGGLLYRDQSGALNESVADVLGTLVKQYSRRENVNTADWLVGSDIMVSALCLRSMRDPHEGFGRSPNGTPGQPSHMREYDNTTADNGGVHINSGIPNHAFYKFAMRLGGNAWERAGRVWYDTLTRGQLPSGMDSFGNPQGPFATFQMFADATMRFTANASEADELAQSWADVGITVAHSGTGSGGGDNSVAALKAKLEGIRRELDDVIQSI